MLFRVRRARRSVENRLNELPGWVGEAQVQRGQSLEPPGEAEILAQRSAELLRRERRLLRHGVARCDR